MNQTLHGQGLGDSETGPHEEHRYTKSQSAQTSRSLGLSLRNVCAGGGLGGAADGGPLLVRC